MLKLGIEEYKRNLKVSFLLRYFCVLAMYPFKDFILLWDKTERIV
ncbi:hypothetical protein ACQUWN_11670 [Rossellomorea aquimaris]|nr:hypothetical protein [Rossellomorea vietnamensis]